MTEQINVRTTLIALEGSLREIVRLTKDKSINLYAKAGLDDVKDIRDLLGLAQTKED